MEAISWQARWVRIDLAAIRHNYRQVRKGLDAKVRLLAVVKGDAYGHGAPEISRTMQELGADMLGVTTVSEGVDLRKNGITMPILVFSPFFPHEADTIAEYGLTATVASLEAAEWLGRAAQRQDKSIAVHLKAETGMGRTGLWPAEIREAADAISGYPQLNLEGVYTHLATAAWTKPAYAHEQFQLFRQVLDILETSGYSGLIRHIANSAALLSFPQMHLDMVRTGTLLYGQHPAPHLEKSISLEDPWSFRARVSYIREIPAGHSVGYGKIFTAKGPTRVAVIPVGFCDGFQMEPVLRPVNPWEVIKGAGKLVLQYLGHSRMEVPVYFAKGRGRVIGKVGMQLSMVDITGIPDVEIGSEASLPLRRTAVSPLITRVYADSRAETEKS